MFFFEFERHLEGILQGSYDGGNHDHPRNHPLVPCGPPIYADTLHLLIEFKS